MGRDPRVPYDNPLESIALANVGELVSRLIVLRSTPSIAGEQEASDIENELSYRWGE